MESQHSGSSWPFATQRQQTSKCARRRKQAALADISPPLQAKRSTIIAEFLKYEPVFTKYGKRKTHFN